MYKTMYVLPKEKYEALLNTSQSSPVQSHSSPVQSHSSPVQSHSSPLQSPVSLCPVCGRDFLNPRTLAHYMKSHVSGHKCNICGKVFQHMRSLRRHLATHRLQAAPDTVGPAA